MGYFDDIRIGIRTTLKGLSLTWKHLQAATRRRSNMGVAAANYFEQQNGLVTLQYPHEQLPIPDHGRYRLHNAIEDCIVCDKCAKICPVDCIEIEAIKATEEIGRASDGSPIRLYAATFDIDMAKCCYCGLCTTVCPTECLTMEKKFDYSTYNLADLTYSFADLTPEQAAEKRALYEQFVREKEALKAVAKTTPSVPEEAASPKPKPIFRPSARPAEAPPPSAEEVAKPKPAFRPMMKPKPDETPTPQDVEKIETPTAKPKPAFRPTLKPQQPETTADVQPDAPKPKPAFRPTLKPQQAETPTEPKSEAMQTQTPKPKPAFRPTMKPKPTASEPDETESAP